MLALKDRWHVVNASIPGLADAARLTIPDTIAALETLSSPDPHSRTKDNEGRRIETCDGGWNILNGEKYRNKMSIDERNEYQRIKQKEYRDRAKDVKSCLQNSQRFTHTDTEADTEQNRQQKVTVALTPDGFDVPPDLLARWKLTYLAVDVPSEVRAAFEWVQANPANRKSNYQRFLVNWLKRTQDRAPRKVVDPPKRESPYVYPIAPTPQTVPELSEEQRAANIRRLGQMTDELGRKVGMA